MKRFELSIMGKDSDGNESAWIPWGSYDTHEAAEQAMRDIRRSNESDTYGRKWKILDIKDGSEDLYLVMDQKHYTPKG